MKGNISSVGKKDLSKNRLVDLTSEIVRSFGKFKSIFQNSSRLSLGNTNRNSRAASEVGTGIDQPTTPRITTLLDFQSSEFRSRTS